MKTDYYPFGMLQPGRQYSVNNYRYGFNGKENDNEVKGEGNQQDYGMRIYDPRLGRFLSVDPLTKKYPANTPYSYAENDVVRCIDLDGSEKIFTFWNPFTFQPVIICFGCGIKEASDNYIGGLTEKAMVQSRQMSYHNDNVPQSVQKRLDNAFTLDADAKIIKGVVQTTKINVETSANIVSTIIPTEELISLGVKGVKQLARLRLASNVYKEAGIGGERLASHLKYIDFEEKVYKQTFEEGTELVQFRRKGFEGGGGDYYAPAGTKPEEVGLDPGDVIESYKVTLKKKVEGLVSSHKRNSPLYYDPTKKSTGGGTQIFSTKINETGTATFTKIQ